jgi:hypothetical protein
MTISVYDRMYDDAVTAHRILESSLDTKERLKAIDTIYTTASEFKSAGEYLEGVAERYENDMVEQGLI